MKTMKKAISVLLLVCMVSALCSAGAYAGNAEGTENTQNTLTIENSNIILDVNSKNTASKSKSVGSATAEGFNGSTATSWNWTSNNESIATVNSAGTITAASQGSTTCSVVAVDANNKSWTGTVNVTVKDSTLASATISTDNNGTLSASARTNDNSDANIVNYEWKSSNDKVTLATPNAAATTYSSTDTSAAQNANITVTVTDNFGATATSQPISVTIPAASSSNGEVKVTKITITSGTSVDVGGQLTLTATVTPSNATNQSISWASTDNEYVTVSNNIVTGKKAGTATITATAGDGGGATASYSITIKNVDVGSVSLNKTSASIPAGSSETLIATVNPSNATDKTVTWTSDDTTVATVDENGKVTAIKEGSAKITATATNGQSATCDVTVTKKTSVRIDITSSLVNNTITARGSTIVLYAKVYKDNALITDSKVSWSITQATSSNGLTKLTDNGCINNAWTASVTGNFNGVYYMAATCTVDGVAYSQSVCVNVAYAPSIVAGNYSVWGGRDALSFLVNDHINNWNQEIWIDGTKVSSAYYTCIGSSDGEIWLTLSPYLLNMINQYSKNSTHTLVVGDTRAAAATGYFRTWGTASSFNGVKTGDDAAPALWAALLAVSAVGAGAAVVIYKRRKTGNG